MSKLFVNAVEPEGAPNVLTLGASGDTVNIAGTAGTGFPAGGFHQVVVKTSSDATYSPDTDVTKIIVEVQGGGGGSGDTTGGTGTSSGAGGGYVMKMLTVTSSYVINIQIGAGGVNGTTNGTAGSASSVTYVSGGDSFATLTAGGGAYGGLNMAGAIGGTAAGGDLNIPGGYGSMESDLSLGGHSWFGYGGVSTGTGNPQARDGVGYGSGASSANPGTGIGADGADGLVVIWEYK